MTDFVQSLIALAAVVLVAGAIFLLRRGGATKQAVLMLVLAFIMAANLVIWSIPVDEANLPASAENQAAPAP